MKYQTISLKFFGVKGAIYYVAIAKVIFSHVKISSFRAKAHLVFHWCLYNNDDIDVLCLISYVLSLMSDILCDVFCLI